MPWISCMPLDARLEFLAEYRRDRWSFRELCLRYHVSRKTGYKWVARYAEAGPTGLQERSRRPRHSPRATPAAVVAALVTLRRQHPRWSAKKLLPLLAAAHPSWALPAISTAQALLKQHGLVRPRPRRRPGRQLQGRAWTPATAPNVVWTADFKGQFRTRDGQWCYPLTILDSYSRYVLACVALPDTTGARAGPIFRAAFRRYGRPQVLRTDNGAPFAARGLGGLSHLAVEWLCRGIRLERIAPGHPEQNGRHERFHRTLKAETACPPAGTRRAQQRRFTSFCHTYNTQRPHEALGQTPPAQHYQASPQAWPRAVPAWDYPGYFEHRRVAANGCVRWGGATVFVGQALHGETLGFDPHPAGLWLVYLQDYLLGVFDPDHLRVEDARTWVQV
ncbi:MAG: IS481 family transposase [Gemmatimonadales bacterium]